MTGTERYLYQFLKEADNFTEDEFLSLQEDTKVETVKSLISFVLQNITEKLDPQDVIIADRSRGDIKQLKELDVLQSAINEIESLIDKSEKAGMVQPEVKQYVGTVIKSILYLNKLSPEFKEAYRNKKTLLIVKYESIILSIISAVAYLISVAVDAKTSGIQLKSKIAIEEIAPLKTLAKFVKEYEANDFKVIFKDVNNLREYCLEVPTDMLSLKESSDILDIVQKGLTNLIGGQYTNKIIHYVYKAVGILALIISVREAIYSFSRSNSTIADAAGFIKNFVSAKITGAVTKMNAFGSKYALDMEEATRQGRADVEDENKEVSRIARTPQFQMPVENPTSEGDDDSSGFAF